MGFRENPENINRKGRPKKGTTLTDILEKQLEKNKKIGSSEKKTREWVINALLELALSNTITCPHCQKAFKFGGDLGALKYIFDRTDGKPVEHLISENEVSYYTVPPKKKPIEKKTKSKKK